MANKKRKIIGLQSGAWMQPNQEISKQQKISPWEITFQWIEFLETVILNKNIIYIDKYCCDKISMQ